MKTMLLAAAAVLSLGVGAAYAEGEGGGGEDGGTIPNTFSRSFPASTRSRASSPMTSRSTHLPRKPIPLRSSLLPPPHRVTEAETRGRAGPRAGPAHAA
jgi:hypothetical protein